MAVPTSASLPKHSQHTNKVPAAGPYLVVLGMAQDAGYPQAGCHRDCCEPARKDRQKRRFPCCVAVVDPQSENRWLLDCTPYFPEQLRLLDELAPVKKTPGITAIFLTHAHIGHYTGLMHLGREAMAASHVPVYLMPKMKTFLERNGPWSLLVQLKNIKLQPLADGQAVELTKELSVTPLSVPHRGEYSETVAFLIEGPNHSALYLPDIDCWEDWNVKIEDVVKKVDRAYVDGTFYSPEELPGRDFSKIPHPPIKDSIKRFSALPLAERKKIHFLHLNHTNPALDPKSEAATTIRHAGHFVAEQRQRLPL